MRTEELRVARTDSILFVTLNRPQQRNAITLAMYDEMFRLFTQVRDDRGVSCVVIAGEGDEAFAAGTDVSEFRDLRTASDIVAYQERTDRVIAALEALPMPTIAAISGACTGAGALLAACCDLRLGQENLRFGIPIARTLGNCLSMRNTRRFVDVLGPSLLKDLILTARLMTAEEALRRDLVRSLHADRRALDEAAAMLARRVAAHAPLTIAATKRSLMRLRDGGSLDAYDLVTECYQSADFRNAVADFEPGATRAWTGA